MDDFVARCDLIPEPELKELTRRSDAAGAGYLVPHLLALAATGWWVWTSPQWWMLAPALLVHGVLLNFLFCPLHETVHGTAFRSRWLNRVVGEVAGLILVSGASYYRHFHFVHHRYTQDPDRDPELANPMPRTLLKHLLRLAGPTAYWWDDLGFLFKHATGRVDEPFIPRRANGEIVREARAYLAVYMLVAVGSVWMSSWAAVALWLGPLFLGGPALRMYLHAEHTGCPLVADMLLNTRTTRTNPIVKRLAWQMPYHTEHHLFPSVPFHALPKLHKLIAGRHGHLSPGYAHYHGEVIARIVDRTYEPAPRGDQ